MSATLPPLPEPDAYRMRFVSEPGMIGHYPWDYRDGPPPTYKRPQFEYEDLFVEEAIDTLVGKVRTACAARDTRIAEMEERIRMAVESIDEGDPTGAAQVLRPALKGATPK